MTFFAFLGALSLSVLGFELISAFQTAFSMFGSNRLISVSSSAPVHRSTWDALLVAILPGRFDPQQARSMTDVISLLRRAGYPYDSPGEFYAVAIRDFSIFLAVGGLLAGALAALNMAVAAPFVAGIFIFLGLRRPYVRLKTLAKRRAESMRNNMLIGLSVLSALLSSGVGVQEALRRASTVGGPFCNLLALLVARMEVEDFSKAIEVTRAHLPDASDVEANLFLRDIYDFFANNRPGAVHGSGVDLSISFKRCLGDRLGNGAVRSVAAPNILGGLVPSDLRG
jgi:hypothetical protein